MFMSEAPQLRSSTMMISPQSVRAVRSQLNGFFNENRMRDFRNKGKKGAKAFGVVAFAAVLSAYSPDAFAQSHYLMSPGTLFLETVNATQKAMPAGGPEFAMDAIAGGQAMAGAVAHYINETIIAPAMGAVRTSGQGFSVWAAAQRDAVMMMGASVIDGVKDIANYLIPETKGEMVEKAIIVVAALKSFAEGLEIAKKTLSAIGRKITGRPAPDAPEAAAKVEIHHHHYYAGPPAAPPAPPAPEPEIRVEETDLAPANDNDGFQI